MKNKSSLRTRFTWVLIAYTGIILALWFAYHNITWQAADRSARENAILAADDITGQINAELGQMKTITSAIAGSSYVQEFLKEKGVNAFYQKAEVVSEIIQKAAFPIASADSVVTISEEGIFYRFSGGLSNPSCEELYKKLQGEGTVFTVVALEDTLFFCHNVPVYDSVGRSPVRIGNVVMLTGLEKIRRMLDTGDVVKNIDTALILNGVVVLSDNETMEGSPAAGLESQYGMITTAPVADTPLTVFAAIPREALFPESGLFFILALVMLGLLLIMILILYRYLSSYMVYPMAGIISHVQEIEGGGSGRLPKTGKGDFDALVSGVNDLLDRTEQYHDDLMEEREKLFDAEILRQNMRISLLSSQMDAHFVVNTLKGIKQLADSGENDKAAQMSDGLAAILKHRHTGDALVNIFVDFEMLEKYILIINMQFGEKFSVHYDVEDNLAAFLIPGMVLQPIVENALVHGLQNKDQEAQLRVKGFIKEDRVQFEISDNGTGIPPEKLKLIQDSLIQPEINDFPEPGLHGVAISNIQRRIHLRFGIDYGITIESVWGKGTMVKITLPIIPDHE